MPGEASQVSNGPLTSQMSALRKNHARRCHFRDGCRLAEALSGAQAVIDVANSPSFEADPALEFSP